MRSGRGWTGIAGLVVLGALLPFELEEPLFAIGPLSITNLELVLYAVLFAWGFGRAGAGLRGLGWSGAHAAVAVWACVVLLSAILAPDGRGDALKFALRSIGGCALFFAAADLVCTTKHAAAVAIAVAAGAVASAVAALAEVAMPGAAAMLLAFKTQTTLVGAFVRGGGTFQHANIAAMYWEAALPAVLGLSAWSATRPKAGVSRFAAVIGAVVLESAIVLSASRGALLATATVLLLLAGASVRRAPALRAPALVGLAGFAFLWIVAVSIHPWMALRLRSETSAAWYRAVYDVAPAALELTAGETMTVTVTVRNEGQITWPSSGDRAVWLSYHWYDPATGRTVVFEGRRTSLPADVAPGERVTVAAPVLAPALPGAYTLRWDMVNDYFWFSAHGDATGDVPARVRPGTAGAAPHAPPPSMPEMAFRPPRAELWRAGLRMWRDRPLLGVGPDRFRHLYGTYLGLAPFDDRIHANNLYIETLATTGAAGGLALAGLVVSFAGSARRAWRRAVDPAGRALGVALAAGLAAFFVHGLFDYFLEFTSCYALFWLLAGTSAGVARDPERPR